MTLTDAGPLIAIIDADESQHAACLQALDIIELPLISTWPTFTEAMYLLARAGRLPDCQALWRLIDTGRLRIAELAPSAIKQSARLMDQGRDTPMDLAEATLVARGEELGQRRIFTLDGDFDVYRRNGRQRFERVPAP